MCCVLADGPASGGVLWIRARTLERKSSKIIEGDDIQGLLMGRFELHLGHALLGQFSASERIQALLPPRNAEAPRAAFGEEGTEVVAFARREIEPILGHDGSNRVRAAVCRAGVAIAVAVEAGHGGGATLRKWTAKDVDRAIHLERIVYGGVPMSATSGS